MKGPLILWTFKLFWSKPWRTISSRLLQLNSLSILSSLLYRLLFDLRTIELTYSISYEILAVKGLLAVMNLFPPESWS